jgi:DNA transformation protein
MGRLVYWNYARKSRGAGICTSPRSGLLGWNGARPYNPAEEFNHPRILPMADDFVEYVMELFGPFGTVGARRMFGGHGVYLDGLMFALVSGDTLYLKADPMNRIEFEQAGCEMFSYARKGKRATISFFRAPEDAMESPELMLPWARTAYAAALRANAKKQVAGQAQAARKTARTEAIAAAPAARSEGVINKRPAKKAPLAKKKSARPAKPVKRGKRTR